ncbi:uncharacterized protein LOC133189444 [Saccostrea echinata]|uniref:uncharacterized protein LOC133189444 n=1 Tax=Saccostrea echinata TaxID=191078 RepID=UPI002A80014B|nr:uncharacterized protein LOC133189444 [Saccostrea echinata]
MNVHLLIFSVFILGVKGLLINLNQTHHPSVSERLDALEKQLAEEKRQRYLLQMKYDQEIEYMNSTDQKLLQVYKTALKQFQDISIQIKGASLSINKQDHRHSLEIQEMLGKLREVQTSLSAFASNQFEIANLHRHFQENENVLTSMLDILKHNETTNNEALIKMKSNLSSLANSIRTLEYTVNANTDKQIRLQTEL